MQLGKMQPDKDVKRGKGPGNGCLGGRRGRLISQIVVLSLVYTLTVKNAGYEL